MQAGFFVAVRIRSFIHSLFQYLLSTCYGPGTVVGPGDIGVNKINLDSSEVSLQI